MALPRQFLKVSALRPYFPGGELNIFISTLRILVGGAIPCSQRLRLGLLGYLIRFAPLAFVPHSQNRSCQMPSPSVVLPGLTHFTGTLGILLTSPGLKFCSLLCTPTGYACRFHKAFTKPATDALDPIIAIPTRGAGVTAAAGTSLSHPLFAKLFALGKSLSKT